MVQREPFKNEDGGYISIGSDITEIKMHEKELELQKEMYGFMVEAINGFVFDPSIDLNAKDIGFFVSDTLLTPSILFNDNETNTYNVIATSNELIIAFGIFFFESFVSSANLGIVSNPL